MLHGVVTWSAADFWKLFGKVGIIFRRTYVKCVKFHSISDDLNQLGKHIRLIWFTLLRHTKYFEFVFASDVYFGGFLDCFISQNEIKSQFLGEQMLWFWLCMLCIVLGVLHDQNTNIVSTNTLLPHMTIKYWKFGTFLA